MTDPFTPPAPEEPNEAAELEKGHNEAQADRVEDDGLSNRGIGVLALVASIFFGYKGYVSPIISAVSGEPSVSISMTFAATAPLLVGLGVTYSILGDEAEKVLGSRHAPSTGGWIFYTVFFVLGLAGYFALEALLQAMGYNT